MEKTPKNAGDLGNTVPKRRRRGKMSSQDVATHRDVRFQVYVAQRTPAGSPVETGPLSRLDVLADAAQLASRMTTSRQNPTSADPDGIKGTRNNGYLQPAEYA
ncbi:hypothetical protein TPAR_06651 [Tolypocladium paradoxum]|uniref:Uncharacterized protein n=1 Tax=Tolypocladium paradoxum TaxID=94208 RepID=A0A2S4KSN5_9HYPO|nr:hypothetical protein TPAR_06651 [Tolypocladium paradoxum]